MNKTFGVVGGDRRQAELGRLLAGDGHSVRTYGLDRWKPVGADTLDRAASADVVILPLPLCRGDGVLNCEEGAVPTADLFRRLRPQQRILAGQVRPQQRQEAEALGLTVEDYFLREELAVANAVPTAEGAVQLAMEHLPITIHGSRVLIIGYGRVGRLTAQRFQALGARVSVAARKYEQLAWAQAMGFGGEHLSNLKGWLCGYDLIVNTVPVQVLGREELEDVKPDCLILDLASKPGGVDLGAAGDLGLTVVWALALPGKVAPVTAGAAIRDTIYNMLREIGL